jgi:hypothetical protein
MSASVFGEYKHILILHTGLIEKLVVQTLELLVTDCLHDLAHLHRIA